MLKTFESPLDSKEIKSVNPKGNQPWIFIGRTDVEAEALILWPSDAKKWLIGKDPDAGKDWRQEKKGATEDEMVGWHHWLNGREFEQTPGDSEGQGSSPWTYEELDTTEPLNNNNNLSVWVCWVFLVVHEISISAACGILVSQPGIEPVSPALQGGFLTIGPPGKSLWDYLYRLETFYLEMS